MAALTTHGQSIFSHECYINGRIKKWRFPIILDNQIKLSLFDVLNDDTVRVGFAKRKMSNAISHIFCFGEKLFSCRIHETGMKADIPNCDPRLFLATSCGENILSPTSGVVKSPKNVPCIIFYKFIYFLRPIFATKYYLLQFHYTKYYLRNYLIK